MESAEKLDGRIDIGRQLLEAAFQLGRRITTGFGRASRARQIEIANAQLERFGLTSIETAHVDFLAQLLELGIVIRFQVAPASSFTKASKSRSNCAAWALADSIC